ncbi:SDR family oxidoreductase, partial [Patulibacter sp. S7RM1-6]
AAAAADIRRPDGLQAAIGELVARLGPVAALCFSPLPDIGGIRPVLDTTPEDLDAALALNVTGAAAAVRAALPALDRGGSVLFTTGSAALEPSAERAVSGVVYRAQTVYARMLREALGPAGVHVAQTVIFGPVGPGKRHDPADVAEHLWTRHRERDDLVTELR